MILTLISSLQASAGIITGPALPPEQIRAEVYCYIPAENGRAAMEAIVRKDDRVGEKTMVLTVILGDLRLRHSSEELKVAVSNDRVLGFVSKHAPVIGTKIALYKSKGKVVRGVFKVDDGQNTIVESRSAKCSENKIIELH